MKHKFPRIAIINVAWSKDYQSDRPVGGHGYVQKGGEGHERYNLVPDYQGKYYLFVPPIGKKYPRPKINENWLVFMVSKRPNESGLVVIAWFDNANFVVDAPIRPDNHELGAHTTEYPHSIESQGAFIVPPPARDFSFAGDHAKRSYTYLRGNCGNEAWREVLAAKLLAYRRKVLEAAGSDSGNDTSNATGGFCTDPAQRKKVENAAINFVRSRFGRNYIFRDRQKFNDGYDLEFEHRKTGKISCVEVKGTSNAAPHFILSSNERLTGAQMAQAGPDAIRQWTLALVVNALTEPSVKFYTYDEMISAFEMKELAWHATPLPKKKAI